MKFLVPNYSCLQIRGLRPPDPRSLCPLSSTEFVEPPPPPRKNSWVRHCVYHTALGTLHYFYDTSSKPFSFTGPDTILSLHFLRL